MIIGVIGFIGSGKDTVGNTLCDIGWKRDSFARSLKDAVSVIFGWDRIKLEGATKEDREWREIPDEYWSNALGKPGFSPRLALQWMGTEAGRRVFGESLWTASTLRRIKNDPGFNYVVTDVRFNNEIVALNEAGALLVRIYRGREPSYFNDACVYNMFGGDLPESLKNVHQSEWDWCGNPLIDYSISNDGTLQELQSKVVELSRIKRVL